MTDGARRTRVVVARAADQAGGLVERLTAAGYAVVEVPVIAIADPHDGGAALTAALERLHTYDWLVVTSPNGAARVAPALQRCPLDQRPRTAAVGPGTARELGITPDLVAGTSIGEGLVADFPPGPGRVLLAQAAAARPIVFQGLVDKGWEVDAVVAYRTVPATPTSAEIDAARAADAVVFTSGSTVRHFVAAVGRLGVPAKVIAIGPATTAVAAELGVVVTATAAIHTLDGVIAALTEVVPPRRRDAP